MVAHHICSLSCVVCVSQSVRERSEENNAISMLIIAAPTSSSSQSYKYWREELAPTQGETQASANLRVSQLSPSQLLGNVCRLGAEAPAKIEGVTLMRPIHSNL